MSSPSMPPWSTTSFMKESPLGQMIRPCTPAAQPYSYKKSQVMSPPNRSR